MRLTCFLAVALMGLLTCSEVVATTDKTFTSKNDQVLSKRLLRTTTQPEADANSNDNERMFFIQTFNTPRYMYWFSLGMTPYDVREKLDLLGEWADLKVFKQSIYRGYVKFYDKHCAIPQQSKEDFCRNKVY